ncbi:MAG: type II toxin-antitoxin system Phd/YefM family antitoxin [Vicinamibacteria bacterium]
MSVADAKRGFSDLLGRVAYGRETILITRRGRPMAKLVPVEESSSPSEALTRRGWLEDDDPFFAIVDEIVSERKRHRPRVLAPTRRHRGSKGRSRPRG